jgi:hypothetical protein
MADIIATIIVTPIMMGIFLLGFGVAIVTHLKTTRYLGNGLATALGFIVMLHCPNPDDARIYLAS